MSASRSAGILLVAPALLLVAALFVYPLVFSVASAISDPAGGVGPANFVKAFELYSGDILYTIFIVAISTALTGLVSIAIAGYLTMGETHGWFRDWRGSIAGRCSSHSSSRPSACARSLPRTEC